MPTMLAQLSAVRTLENLYNGFEQAKVELEEYRGSPVCGMCGICCMENTPCGWAIEAANVVYTYASRPEELYHINRICEEWIQLPGCGAGNIGDEVNYIMGSKCPFLSLRGRCIIYEARPMVCRAMGVTRSPHPSCLRPPGKGDIGQFKSIWYGPHSEALERKVGRFVKQLVAEGPSVSTYSFLPSLVLAKIDTKRFNDLLNSGKAYKYKIVRSRFSQGMGLLFQSQIVGSTPINMEALRV